MKIEEEKLTEYLFGDMTPEDRVELEKQLAEDPEAQQFVAEMQDIAGAISQGFEMETLPEVDAAPAPTAPVKSFPVFTILSAAAALVIGFFIVNNNFGPQSKAKEISKHDEKPANNVKAPPKEEADNLKDANDPGSEQQDFLLEQRKLEELRKLEETKKRHVEEMSRRHWSWSGQTLNGGKILGYHANDKLISDNSIRGIKYYKHNIDIEAKGDRYANITENWFLSVKKQPLSTFAADVDTASYSNMRRYLNSSTLPPANSVRIEEMVNYFSYDYAAVKGDHPFNVDVEIGSCPWEKNHKLVRVGIQGKKITDEKKPDSNLVFLVDVSGSMADHNKLPLLKQSFKMLLSKLGERDKVAMVVYADATGLVLPSTRCNEKGKILKALDKLSAGGSTNGGAGINLAYKIASDNFIKGGVNRVILATDGDFNVGASSDKDLEKMIKEKAKTGVFLTVLGFGMGNLNDSMMEKISNAGNGNFAYIDTINEARKVMVNELSSTLVTIAKDVKIQVEFNPANVKAYRLIGYENRKMKAKDFNDDKKKAGEIGAGHQVTALYQIVPPGVDIEKKILLKYQPVVAKDIKDTKFVKKDELMTVKIRYKKPDGDKSKLFEYAVKNKPKDFSKCSPGFRFASSVAGFGMLLRDSRFKGNATYDSIKESALGSKGKDPFGYRLEFINLIDKAKKIKK